MLIRFLLESYLELCICALLNMMFLSDKGSGEIMGAMFATSYVGILTLLPIIISWFLLRYRHVLKKKKIERKYGAFYEDLRVNCEYSLHNNFYFTCRRLLFAYSVVFLVKFQALQIMFLLAPSAALLIFFTTV